MRIDGTSPIAPAGGDPAIREVKPVPVHPPKEPIKDHVEVQPKVENTATNVLVEMQPGNVVVYKFIDEASGRLIQQIPSAQMLNISESVQPATGKKRT
jgi:hypothetical protein